VDDGPAGCRQIEDRGEPEAGALRQGYRVFLLDGDDVRRRLHADLGFSRPNLGRLAQRGTLSRMHTTVPDFSCVAWTSFATGVNPGKHGIYGFQDFHSKTGEVFTPTVADCRAPALWHEVGKAGGRSIVLNLPGTYPAMPLRGKMVSGFVAPEFDKACYPATFAQTLKTLGYRMDLDGQMGLAGSRHVEQAIGPVFDARKTAIRHIIKNEYWDLCIAVITESDRLQHFFLHALSDPGHPQYQWTRRFYVELDAFIAEIAELVDGKADLFMVSDHGFDVVRHLVLVEDFLRDLGLAPASDVPCWSNAGLPLPEHTLLEQTLGGYPRLETGSRKRQRTRGA